MEEAGGSNPPEPISGGQHDECSEKSVREKGHEGFEPGSEAKRNDCGSKSVRTHLFTYYSI
jgi:hypothetical protein